MNPTHQGKPDFENKPTSRSDPTKLKSFFVLAIGLAIPILAVVLSLAAWNFNERHPRTDDGVARANLIGVAANRDYRLNLLRQELVEVF